MDRVVTYDHHQIHHVVILRYSSHIPRGHFMLKWVVLTCLLHHRQGKFYKLNIISEDGRVLPPIGIKKQLEKIVKIAGGQ